LARFKLLAFAATCLIVSGVLVAGCGGGDEDPEDVLTQTFSGDHQVDSGTLDMSISGAVEGSTGGSIDASVSGPFQAEEGQFPEFDLAASVTGEGAGQSVDFQGGLTSAGDKLYVTYQDTPYEVPDDVFKQVEQNYQDNAAQAQDAGGSFQERCQQAAQQGGFDPSLCDVDPLSLVTNLSNEGDEDVEGTDTVHVSGDINVAEIGNLASEAIAASPSGQFLPQDQLDQLSQQGEDAIDEASFDVYSGKDDDILRRLDLSIAVTAPEAAALVTPVSGANVDFSVSIGAVNEPQTIEAPTDAKPLDDLLDEVGASGLPLGGLGGGAIPGLGDEGLPDLGGGTGGDGGTGGGSPDAYLNCIENANTPTEIASCANETQ
jgi:hypothetical protein